MILDDYLQYDRIRIITNDGEKYEGTPVMVNCANKEQRVQNEILLDMVFEAQHKFVRIKQKDINSIEVLPDEKHINIQPDIVPYECRKCGIGKMESKSNGRVYVCSNPDCNSVFWINVADK